MRYSRLVLLSCVLWLVLPNAAALADGMVLPLPQALDSDYLAVRIHQVHVQIEDGLAVTRVEQEFYNPYDFPVAGGYLFPIPPEAILSEFEAVVDGLKQHVIRQSAAETNAALYAAISRQSDPSLLRYADWESLAFDLSLEPGESRKMILEYQEMLLPRGGLYRYRYVLSTERYSSRPLEQVSVTVDLRSSLGIASLYSSSHPVAIETLPDGRSRVQWEARHAHPTEDFELYFAPAGDGAGGGLLTGQRHGQGHFLFLFSPEVGQSPSTRLPKDIIFVMDRSGSMDGDKIQQVRSALHDILGRLHPNDRFALLGFNDRVSALSYALQPADSDALDDARRFVDGLSAEGGTDLETALRTALEILLGTKERGATRLIVFLSDGLPTSGITDERVILDSLASANEATSARYHAFGVGYDVNTHLLDGLVADSRGTVTYVRPNENLEMALSEFYGKVADPVLTDLEVDFQGVEVSELYPRTPPDLFVGSSLLLAGLYQDSTGSMTVRVRGWAGEERHEYAYHFRLDELQKHDFVPRLWATRRVGALLDRVRIEGWSQSLEDAIRELGLGYGIVTPYTEFAIEGQATGAASADNLALYGAAELNQASGRVTVEARLQNQAYQQAAQVSLATGANLSHYGQSSLAEIGAQQVDLALLQGREDLDEPLTGEWLEHNLRPDRTVTFGSPEYFALAAVPEIRPYLQSGRDVVFSHEGEVIAIRDQSPENSGSHAGQVSEGASTTTQGKARNRGEVLAVWTSLPWFFRGLALTGMLWLLFWLLTAAAVLGYVVRVRET
jgi:Ca-activated chloride channel family protein